MKTAYFFGLNLIVISNILMTAEDANRAQYLFLINLLLRSADGALCSKHSLLGIAHFAFSPYLCTHENKYPTKSRQQGKNGHSHRGPSIAQGADEPHLRAPQRGAADGAIHLQQKIWRASRITTGESRHPLHTAAGGSAEPERLFRTT